jgi:DNA-binding MarR family transcriptional regulator
MEALSDHQHQLLTALKAAGRPTKHELVEATALPGMAVAQVLRDLEGQRLVAKDVDSNRQAVVWQLTARGVDVLDMES